MALCPLQQCPRTLSTLMKVASAVVGIAFVVSLIAASSEAAEPPIKFLSGAKFKDSLDQTMGLSWTDQVLRPGLQKLSAAREVAIVLDRRIDPNTKLSLTTQRAAFRDLLVGVSEQAKTGLSVVGNTIYLGPPTTTARLRTMNELLSNQLVSPDGATKKSAFGLLQRRSLNWDDLDRPADLVVRAAELFSLKIENLEAVPHDLWAAGSIPSSTATEMLSLLLCQFDLSFEWVGNASGIRLVPMPESPTIERSYDAKTTAKAAEYARSWPAEFPDLSATAKGSRVLVSGTVEQHDDIDGLLHPARAAIRKPKAASIVSYSFELRSAPLQACLDAMEKQSDLRFEYDANALREAGIKLDQLITMKVDKASAAELLESLFDKTGIAFELDGTTAKLKPKRR